MNKISILLIANLCAITCAVFAGLLALNHISGWGWFLAIALFTIPSISYKKKD